MNQLLGATVLTVATWVPTTRVVTAPSGGEETENRAKSYSGDWVSEEDECYGLASQPLPDSESKCALLVVVTKEPSLDDEEIADRIGLPAVEVSRLLREMEDDGLVVGR